MIRDMIRLIHEAKELSLYRLEAIDYLHVAVTVAVEPAQPVGTV
jgi:hypothetical protein